MSVRCSTDNLVLCQDCIWDAHGSCSVSAAHDWNPDEDSHSDGRGIEIKIEEIGRIRTGLDLRSEAFAMMARCWEERDELDMKVGSRVQCSVADLDLPRHLDGSLCNRLRAEQAG
ncbi:hypothetical protein F0562_011072 [Nyssa sinensis]|uniref:B box-type domain-containing protein n=1 Tax=Nyssa sinensis TaxID=561372 RepID=A0A5J5A2X2_9ASTE|nr:hypothetical protein F0562_011072 [Nyssa sinensis]